MSSQVRRKIMYWFTLVLGILILCVQFYRYVKGSLELGLAEGAVTIFAVVFMVNPHAISNSYNSIIKWKFNGSKDEQ